MLSLHLHVWVAWLVGAATLDTSAASLQDFSLPNTNTCAHVRMLADEALCDTDVCRLHGHARLTCDNLWLRGDVIEVRIGANQVFQGAKASGNVLLVEGTRVLTCEALELDGDRIRGRIQAAKLEIRRELLTDKAACSDCVPGGRNAFVAHGDIYRDSANNLRLEKADLTLCDCGDQQAPSWRFDAKRIDLRLNDRATIWWPTLRIRIGQKRLIPITPPMLPLSIPLKSRAMGFLPPQLSFLRFPYPVIDVPFFIPLGPSYDLTITPGVHTAWHAPRLGARFRYQPTESTSGIFRLAYTHDGEHQMAKEARQRALAINPDLVTDPTFIALDAQNRMLTERLSVQFKHQSIWEHNTQRVDALVDAVWISDDLVNRDLQVAPEQRVAAYLPSRAAVSVSVPQGFARLAADAMLRLDNSQMLAQTQQRIPDVSNLRGAETTTLHRAPALSVGLFPYALTKHMRFYATGSWVRYGNWSGHAAPQWTDARLHVQNLATGVSWERRVGPVEMSVRHGVDFLAVQALSQPGLIDLAPLSRADLGLFLGRFGRRWKHLIKPRLTYQGLHATTATPRALLTLAQRALDPRFLRRPSQQLMLGVSQSLWQQTQPSTVPMRRGGLFVGIPYDLRGQRLLQPLAEASINWPPTSSASVRVSLDPRRMHTLPIRELAGQWTQRIGTTSLAFEYNRLAPDADRFQRSIYELSAPLGILEPQSSDSWVHTLRASLEFQWQKRLLIHYVTTYQLPQLEKPADFQDPVCRTRSGKNSKHCFTSHLLSLAYQSPCACWGIESILSAAPQDIWHTLRFQILLNVAGVRLGKTAG